MKHIAILLFAATLPCAASAQSMEELTSYDQTLLSKISHEQRKTRYEARHGNQTTITLNMNYEPKGKDGMDVFPDTLYVGEPFDVHYGTMEGHEATFELYDRRGKRPKRMAWERASTSINGYTVVRIVIDEPGTYEVVAYDEEILQLASQPELMKSRWVFEIHTQRDEKPQQE
ncbi:hypothetical protein [Alistipes sp.]|uniref:hypothetical protein n=1 Tax=Alistipes sp. TaxID=1872444 RepID=UPI003AF008EA